MISPFSKACPFFSVVFERFIPVSAATCMIRKAEKNVGKLLAEFVVYLKISSIVVFDYRNNVRHVL